MRCGASIAAWANEDGRADPVRDVFAARAVGGLDAHRPALHRQPSALHGDEIADPGGAVSGQAKPRHLEGEAGQLDEDNAGLHWDRRLPTHEAGAFSAGANPTDAR